MKRLTEASKSSPRAAQRLQKILAKAGVASRRQAEKLILAGRVRVNGRVVKELGAQAGPRDRVEFDGRRLVADPLVYGVLNKPRGVVSTLTDPQGRRTVRDLLKDVGVRVVPVGRLDYHTSGVLLFTNDGEFQSKLQHPRTSAPRVYVAKVKGVVDDEALTHWQESIEIDQKPTRPAEVRKLRVEGDKTWLEITLMEGKNQHIKRLGEHAGQPVLRLSRVSQAGITHERLRPSQWRLLEVDELKQLKQAYGVPKNIAAAARAGGRALAARSTRGKSTRHGGRPGR